MKILTYKPGTKIRTKKKMKRNWNRSYLNKEGVVVGAGDSSGCIKVKVLNITFDVRPEEIELIKPLRLKKFSAWN